MASYNLNEVLKQKAAENARKDDGEVRLDDVTRVKVLSPGRQVFKRFIRNRLAVFGTILLIIMFVFSFLGPLAYPYGQKQIFYKYDKQNVNYALAKYNSTYNGYVSDPAVELSQTARSTTNTNVKLMAANGEASVRFLVDDVIYQHTQLGEGVVMLGKYDTQKVCSFGDTTYFVGTYSSIAKTVEYAIDPLGAEFDAAAMQNCKGTGGTFELDGVQYSFEKGTAVKTFDIYASSSDAFIYTGKNLGAAFETAANAAAETGISGAAFSADGKDYTVLIDRDEMTAYEISNLQNGMVYTNFALDTYETGGKYSDEFRVNALLSAYDTGAFTADGQSYTVSDEGGTLVIRDAEGKEYAEFTSFVIRRYNGEDTMEYGLKKAIQSEIEKMTGAGLQKGELTYALPMQNEAGEYDYDENGQLKYNDTLLHLTQHDTGVFVVNCDQIIYAIDIYAAPSKDHILGTDSDGFDVMSRIMYGGRISLMVGFVVVFLETFLGVIMGGLAGFYGGWVDNIIMRLVDIFYCLPSMPIMIILGAMMDALRMDTYIRLMIMMGALGIMGWAGIARLVRGQILSLREQEFMVAAEATGIKVKDRIFRHLVPNVMPQLIVSATMGMGGTILTESTLSFLGLGVKHPLATWGTIINSVSSASAMKHYVFIWVPVGLLICLTVIAFNFVGDGLRDAYDPKAKR